MVTAAKETYGTNLSRIVYDQASAKLLQRLGFCVETNTGQRSATTQFSTLNHATQDIPLGRLGDPKGSNRTP